jgi:hypothetical protein
MRGVVLLVSLLAVTAQAETLEERRGGTIWQQSTNAPPIARVWGSGTSIFGVGAAGAYFSLDAGASWAPIDGYGPANGVWGTGLDDIWIVRAHTIHHSADGHGKHWTTQSLPMLSFDAAMEGIWGVDRDRYVFGVDRSDGTARGTIARSRDRGVTWRDEPLPIAIERIAGMWGSAANDVYAVGARGVVLHSSGDGQWRVVRTPAQGAASLEGIWGASATSIYAVGTGGTILHSVDRGKTWRPRASGVTYTLASIMGVDREILVGSADGAPLRSTDGATWRPMTALVSRGHVWAIDREHAIVATTSNVQFLGEAPVIENRSRAPLSTPAVQPAGCANEFVDEAAGDEAVSANNFTAALQHYERAAHCWGGVRMKAYHLACVTGNAGRASYHFARLHTRRTVETLDHCLTRGIDPRFVAP